MHISGSTSKASNFIPIKPMKQSKKGLSSAERSLKSMPKRLMIYVENIRSEWVGKLKLYMEDSPENRLTYFNDEFKSKQIIWSGSVCSGYTRLSSSLSMLSRNQGYSGAHPRQLVYTTPPFTAPSPFSTVTGRIPSTTSLRAARRLL